MPRTVLVLGLSIFVLGTSEFMIAGLLPSISGELNVGIPQAGLLISAFAAGMLVGAPLFAAATLRVPRKAALLGTLTAFALGHVLGAAAPSYGVLFASRVLSAVACAGFWSVAAATAVAVVPENRRARALAILAGGLTVASVLGVPAGTFLGQHAGWRAALWAVAALAALALAGVAAFVPPTRAAEAGTPMRRELRVYQNPRLWLALATTSVTMCAVMATFSYLSPLLTRAIGLPPAWMPVVLGLYGLGALLGITVGGRLADAHPMAILVAGNALAIAVVAVLAVVPPVPVAIAAAGALGFAGFITNPALTTRVFALTPGAPTLAGASNVSAFNTGILAAPVLAGLPINAGLGYVSVTWVSVGLATLALLAIAWAAALQRRRGLPALCLVERR